MGQQEKAAHAKRKEQREIAGDETATSIVQPVRTSDEKENQNGFGKQTLRAPGEDDDGYDPYSDYREPAPFYEDDPWR